MVVMLSKSEPTGQQFSVRGVVGNLFSGIHGSRDVQRYLSFRSRSHTSETAGADPTNNFRPDLNKTTPDLPLEDSF